MVKGQRVLGLYESYRTSSHYTSILIVEHAATFSAITGAAVPLPDLHVSSTSRCKLEIIVMVESSTQTTNQTPSPPKSSCIAPLTLAPCGAAAVTIGGETGAVAVAEKLEAAPVLSGGATAVSVVAVVPAALTTALVVTGAGVDAEAEDAEVVSGEPGATVARVLVAPHSDSGVPLGQQPPSVQ